jgi:tetratricopeptide (TPR) repeat protein
LDYTDYANYDEERDSDTAAKLPSYDELLTRAGRYGEAEDYYLAKIKKITDSDGDTRNTGAEWGGDPFSGLVALYDKVGRVDDVLALANQNPDWGEKDLVGLSAKVQKAVGVALASKGQKAEAEEILKFALLQEPSEDSYYEALLALSPGDVTGWLDQLSQEYPFEKRPLIWKSKILFDQGKLDEAEKTVRAAIKIDPSDGQSGKGDRMRAYADLADILEKKGGAEEAKSCRNIVSAIRMSETADDYLSAGLVKRAIDQYGKSLEVFSDAYCIQSRMAIRLHDLGDYKEAEKHYEKAYELMPDSFGRVESHCFGCERVFEGNLAETTAEKVFQRLCLERPKSPQVHYLLGYLRTLQRRWSEAADSFWQAVQLDPDYLNAWNKLEEVSSHLSFTGAQKSKIGLNQLRLNPACITDSQLISSINPMEAWNALRENEKKQLERPEEFYPLKASADRLEELKKLGQANPNYDIYFRDRLLVNPAMGVVNQSVTKNVIVIMTGKPDYNF